jgi:hypothetical protein
MASLGWVGVAPDYIGQMGFGDPSTTTHGYLIAEQAALGSWDAVRAAQKFVATLDTGFDTTSDTVIWGGSQGGHAALFMEQYGPYYAPEIKVPTVVAAVPPSVLLPLGRKAMSAFTPPTVAFAAVLSTMHKWYGRPHDLEAELTDDAPYHFASTIDDQVFRTQTCDTGAAYDDIDNHPEQQHVDFVYRQPLIDAVLAGNLDAMDPWGCLFKENSLGDTTVKAKRFTPTLMVYSEKDDLVVTEPMRQDFDRLCSLGYRLAYHECMNASHTHGAVWSIPEQVQWVQDRLAGKALPADMCQRKAPVCCGAEPADQCTATP